MAGFLFANSAIYEELYCNLKTWNHDNQDTERI